MIHFNMDNNSKENIEYQKGFNEGYLVAQHLPELSNSLAKIESTSPRIEGFHDGHQQLLLEQIRKQRINRDDKNKEKGFDDFER